MNYMLDTNICIYAMKNKPAQVLQRLEREISNGVYISSITVAELEYGVRKSSFAEKNMQALLRFLLPFIILPFDASAASEYGIVRSYLQKRGEIIGPMGMLIAAHAKAENMTIVTNNTGEFSRVPDLKIEDWSK